MISDPEGATSTFRPIRVVQYAGNGDARLAILADPPERAVDAAVLRMDVAGAIREARVTGVSLEAFIEERMAGSSPDLGVDLERNVVFTRHGVWPLTTPISPPEVWAAGVTYLRSRRAREAESESSSSVYSLVYQADRPELFLKDAGSRRTVGPGEEIRIRGDSRWTVPEPEIALVLNAEARIVGYTIGNDVSARDIEAENPLYLPQAKTYRASCALGPSVLIAEGPPPPFDIELRVRDGDDTLLLRDVTSTARMRRTFEELALYLRRCNVVEDGTVLLTGTGIVPPDDFALEPGWVVEIEVPGIGTLRNTVGLEDAA